jgi:hypothetical protein
MFYLPILNQVLILLAFGNVKTQPDDFSDGAPILDW